MLRKLLGLSALFLLWAVPARAQTVTADTTVGTVVSDTGEFSVTGGSQRLNTLFHSFSEFSPGVNNVTFDLTDAQGDVRSVIGRVTGSNASFIDGQLSITGGTTPDLFLINPNGITFGANASLSLNGSFGASTAESILFSDGLVFSSTNPGAAPLLTVTTPTGLQLGANAGPIQVQGTLQVPTGEALTLAGSQIDMTGATLKAPDGRIELWAVQDAQLTNTQPWQLASSATAANWGNIMLQQVSLVDASGTTYGGGINVRGRGLTLKEESNIRSFTFSGQGQGITVNTTDFVELLGTTNPIIPFAFNGISTSVGNSRGVVVLPGPSATGRAGDITIETEHLRLANAAWLQSITAGDNSSTGDITVLATDVDLGGLNDKPTPISNVIHSLIIAGSNNQSGQVTVEAEQVRLIDGGRISSSVFSGNGQAGEVTIQATESLEIRGVTAIQDISSAVLSSIEAGATGQSGQISIDTGLLTLSEGGAITSAVAGVQLGGFRGPLPAAQGAAGSIDIRAREVQVSDPVIDAVSQTLTGITASLGNGAIGSGGSIKLTADSLRVSDGGQVTTSSLGQGAAGSIDLNVNALDVQGSSQSLLNGQYLPSAITAAANSSFDAGSVNIVSDNLQVRDGARITVSNAGSGNAGNLNAKARTIFLDNGNLSAEVNGGGQGNIFLQADDTLVLRQGSNVTTNAQGASTGGNININARLIAAVPSENSDIVANAVQGNGGNIQITTEGIFGLAFQPELTENSDITASSEFGVSGTVAVNNLSVDPSSGLVELPDTAFDPSQQIAQGCNASDRSTFVATGRGGLPANPVERLEVNRPWADVRMISELSSSTALPSVELTEQPASTVEANSWEVDNNGQVALVAVNTHQQQLDNPIASCSDFALTSQR